MRSLLAAVAAAALLTGCASAQAVTSVTSVTAGPAARAEAEALAAHLVREVWVPAGTKTVRMRSLPRDVGYSLGLPGPEWVTASRIAQAPGNAATVLDGLLAHQPFNEQGDTETVPVTVDTLMEAPEPGIDAAVAEVSIMQYNRTTALIVIRAFVAWLPVRSAAEHIDPAAVRAVAITEQQFAPPARTIARTFASPRVIAGLAAIINASAAAPRFALPCPLPPDQETVKFEPRSTNGRTIVVSVSGCGSDDVTVNGVTQPSLWDTNGRLAALARRLAGA